MIIEACVDGYPLARAVAGLFGGREGSDFMDGYLGWGISATVPTGLPTAHRTGVVLRQRGVRITNPNPNRTATHLHLPN